MLTVLTTPVFGSERRRLVDLAAKNRLPTVFPFREYVDARGLRSYGPSLADMSRCWPTIPRPVTDRLGRLLLVTLEAARIDADLPVLGALRSWLDSWRRRVWHGPPGL